MNKIAIVTLSRGYGGLSDYNSLIERNNSIYENIVKNSKYNFDNIIFHEGNISVDHQNYIKVLSKIELIFVDVKTSGSKNGFNDLNVKNESQFCHPTPESGWFPLGYKHMCHFWAIDFFDYLSEYDYVIRIDEDCVVNRFNQDYIQQLIDGKKVFLSPLFQGKDESYVTVGLENLWSKFLTDNSIIVDKKFDDIKCPYTNFTCLNLKYFKENIMVQKFLQCINDSNCIYINRWGDLPIWGLVLSSFVDENLFGSANGIGYYHHSHRSQVN